MGFNGAIKHVDRLLDHSAISSFIRDDFQRVSVNVDLLPTRQLATAASAAAAAAAAVKAAFYPRSLAIIFKMSM